MWFITALILLVCIIICLVRVFLGPRAPSRLVAFDTMNTLVVTGMVVLGVAFEQVIFIDVAITYALLSFIMTLYVARYCEGGKF